MQISCEDYFSRRFYYLNNNVAVNYIIQSQKSVLMNTT